MNNLLSILSGRLMSALFPAALAVSFLVPANVLAAALLLSSGGGGDGFTEGDPLDTNDVGGSRDGDGGSDVYDKSSSDSIFNPFRFELGQVQVLLIPEFVGGTLIFKIMIVDNDVAGMSDSSPEGIHAP